MYYKHSGHFSLDGLLIGIGMGIVSGFVLAVSYAYGIIAVPYDQLAIIVTCAFGGLLGAATGYGFVWGKVRNQTVAVAATFIISAFALYLSWAFWVSAILVRVQADPVSWMRLAGNPHGLWDLISAINQEGTWSINNGPATKGLELWGIWSAEAVAVIGMAIAIQIGILNRHAFCDRCDCWCTSDTKLLLTPPRSCDQLKVQLEANDVRTLESLPGAGKSQNHLYVVLDSCARCRQFHTISLTVQVVTKNWLGQPRLAKREVLKHLIIGPGPAETLRQLSRTLASGAKSAPARAQAAAAAKK
jgi:hypothetical protein